MFATYIGVLRPGVRDCPDAYLDKPFDVFEAYYEICGVTRIPEGWRSFVGDGKQMDWGSRLCICDRRAMNRLLNIGIGHLIPITLTAEGEAERGAPVSALALPDGDWYGILEVELW